MPETIKIVDNDRVWYDPEIKNNDPVVYQNINYATGNPKSVAKTRHRYIQDLNKRIIPNSVRHGLSLTANSPGSGDIDVSAGYAVVGGRFLEIDALTFDTNAESLTGGTDYYLAIKVTPIAEGGTRDPSGESADIRAIAVSGYTTLHNELVLAKFTYTGSAVSDFVDYVAEQEWQANVFSPVAAHPDSSDGSTQIMLRAGQVQRIDNFGIETTTSRVYLTLTLEDQDGSPVGTTQIINRNQITEFRDGADATYTSVDMLNLRTGGTQRMSSSGNMTNIGTLNSHTIPGGTDTFVMRNTTDTLTNKTLTSPTLNSAQINSTSLRSVQIDDTSNDHQYIVDVSELTADRTVTLPLLTGNDTFVFQAHTQTMTNKTLTTPVIATLYQNAGKTNLITFPATSDTMVGKNTTDVLSNKTLTTLTIKDSDASNNINFTVPNLTADRTIEIPTLSATADDNELITKIATQTLSNKTLLDPTIGTGEWTNASHTHADGDNGGNLSATVLTSGTLGVARGGTGLSTITDGGIMLGNGTSTVTVTSRPTSGQVLIGQSSGDPSLTTISGDVSMTSAGVVTVVNDSHTHDTRYYTESEMDAFLSKESSNTTWVELTPLTGGSENEFQIDGEFVTLNPDTVIGTFAVLYYKFAGIPTKKGSQRMRVKTIKADFNSLDANNYLTSITLNRRDSHNHTDQSWTNSTDRTSGGEYEYSVSENDVLNADDQTLELSLAFTHENPASDFSPRITRILAEIYYT